MICQELDSEKIVPVCLNAASHIGGGFVASCCFAYKINLTIITIFPPSLPCFPQMMAKPSESPVGRQHQSHPEETEEELREHQDGGALPSGVTIKQEPLDPQELQEEAMQQHRERQAEQELLFRQVVDGGAELKEMNE